MFIYPQNKFRGIAIVSNVRWKGTNWNWIWLSIANNIFALCNAFCKFIRSWESWDVHYILELDSLPATTSSIGNKKQKIGMHLDKT